MTLLVVVRARNCILAHSDRKESVAQSDPNEVTKYYLSDAGEIYMALSGDGVLAGHLLGGLRLRQPSGASIFGEIDRLAAELFAVQISGEVAGHLIVADGGEFKVYAITITSGIPAYIPNDDPMHAEGDARAVAICKNLAKDMPLSDMPCETAARCMHAIVSRIAETVDSVGGHARYGIDVIAFTATGAAMQLRRRTDTMGSIRVRFEASGTGPLFDQDVGA